MVLAVIQRNVVAPRIQKQLSLAAVEMGKNYSLILGIRLWTHELYFLFKHVKRF